MHYIFKYSFYSGQILLVHNLNQINHFTYRSSDADIWVNIFFYKQSISIMVNTKIKRDQLTYNSSELKDNGNGNGNTHHIAWTDTGLNR